MAEAPAASLPDLLLKAGKMISADPVAAYAYNPAQVRWFASLYDPAPSLTISEFLKGNGLGGSWALVTAWSAIMFGTSSPHFCGRRPFGKAWPFMKSARLVTTTASLGDTGPIQRAMKLLFPHGRWTQSRGIGKPYYSEGRTDTDWSWDVMNYNQAVEEFASHTKGLILFSEPPPEGVFQEAVSRLRGRGMVLVDMTQLDEAGWNEDLLERGFVGADGKATKGSTVRHVYGHHHEACAEHNVGGHRTHESIEAEYALWLKQGKANAEARASGRAMALTGRVYPNWNEANELDGLLDYHLDCVEAGMVRYASIIDPHDRKPWAMTWWACFPNEDVVCLAEWPNLPFHKTPDSPIHKVEQYRDVILEWEAALGRKVTLRGVDGQFGAAIKSGKGLNVVQMLASPCDACEEKYGVDGARAQCPHRLTYKLAPAYKGSVRDGHALVRAHVGNLDGSRPKVYALREFTPNFCYGMRHYGWKPQREGRGASEDPQLEHKDFPDNVRMLLQLGWHKWPDPPSPTKLIPKRKR